MGWVPVATLMSGMLLSNAGGQDLQIVNTHRTSVVETAYNLEVADFGAYFVGQHHVLVHNCSINNYVDLTTPSRRKHILDGDATGGGHRNGTGKPGKSEFPKDWTDEKILNEISDVATDPKLPTIRQPNGRNVTKGTRDGVDITVVQEQSAEIVTGFPTNVPKNPK